MNIDLDNVDKLLDKLVAETDNSISKRLSSVGDGDIANLDRVIKSKLDYINLLQIYKSLKDIGEVKPEVIIKNQDVIDKAAVDRRLANIVSCRIKTLNFSFDKDVQYKKFQTLSESWFRDFLRTSINYKESLEVNIRVLDKQLDSALATCYSSSVA